MTKEVIQKAKSQIKNKWFETKEDELDMSLNIIDDLLLENKKYKEVIDKAIEYIENGDLLYLASKCSIIYKDNIEIVAICERLENLLKILKEVE